jgi:UDP-N-acetylmuramoylalanine--D-glutamate ligase
MKLSGRDILVVGLARTGLSAANFLIGKGARVSVTDLRTKDELNDRIARLRGQVRLLLGRHREADFTGADMIVLSPGVPSGIPPLMRARERGVPVWSEIELACRFLKGTLIGVTGTNGKTTTTTLIGEMLAASRRPHLVAGNIGVPLLEKLEDATEETVWVVELSSFQLETTRTLRCRVAVVLNVTPDHLDRHPSFEDYWQAKRRILLNQEESDFAVFNRDEPNSRRMADGAQARSLFFSRLDRCTGVFSRDGKIWIQLDDESRLVMERSQIRLRGEHNLENVLAAAAAAFLVGVEPEAIARACRSFAGVEHRLEWIRDLEGVSFYNDSKATNVESASKAMEALEQPLVAIMGGTNKGSDFRVLRPLVKRKVRHLVLLGEARESLMEGLRGTAPVSEVGGLEEAVRRAFVEALPGDAVLLAPACASFDMFRNYEERGRAFKDLVSQLTGGERQ